MEHPGQWQSVSIQPQTTASVLQLGKLHYTTRLFVTTADAGILQVTFYLAVRLLNFMQRLMMSGFICIHLSLINSSCFQLHLYCVCVTRFQQWEATGKLLEAGPLSPWEEQGALEEICWQDLWSHGGPVLQQPLPEGLVPIGAIHLRPGLDDPWGFFPSQLSVVLYLHPMGRTHTGALWGSIMEGTLHWCREACEESYPWGGRSGRASMWWTECSPHSPSACASEGEEIISLPFFLSLGRRGGRFGFVSPNPTLI